MLRGWRRLGLLAAALPLLGIAGCGDTTTIPQVDTATPFATANVAIRQLGNAPVTVDAGSVTFKLDAARSLVATVDVRSHASRTVTITMRGTLYDPKGNIVGDVSGGQVGVNAGGVAHLILSGPTPLGTIAAATFEASTAALPS